MELNRSHPLADGLLAGAWLLVVGWQVEVSDLGSANGSASPNGRP